MSITDLYFRQKRSTVWNWGPYSWVLV